MIRIMIVSKHNEVRDGLCMLLQLAENDVAVTGIVSSLDQAIEQASKGSPDVVLIDLEMPDSEGYETLRQLKRSYPGVKLIALTAHDYQAAKQRAMTAGADMVMVKGIDVSEMITTIQMNGEKAKLPKVNEDPKMVRNRIEEEKDA